MDKPIEDLLREFSNDAAGVCIADRSGFAIGATGALPSHAAPFAANLSQRARNLVGGEGGEENPATLILETTAHTYTIVKSAHDNDAVTIAVKK